jgi:Meiotically up-regulated gene 113
MKKYMGCEDAAAYCGMDKRRFVAAFNKFAALLGSMPPYGATTWYAYRIAELDQFKVYYEEVFRQEQEKRKEVKASYIYIISADAYTKIGVSANPRSRLASLQGSCPLKIILRLLIQQDIAPYELERALHLALNGSVLPYSREWFLCDKEQVATALTGILPVYADRGHQQVIDYKDIDDKIRPEYGDYWHDI